jgi:gamma-glutamylcyclotransferase (GGCT)/AIG2-like uncharacterized protein YtfP
LLKIKRKLKRDQNLDAYYFGYGANLSIDRFRKWHIPAEIVGTAFIKNYKIKFNLPCEYKGKGFAGIEQSQGEMVWGILFKVNSKALKMLDVLEWVPFNFYERKLFVVMQNEETFKNVHSYVTSNPQYNLVPSKAYLDFIINSGIRANFPKYYLDELSSTPTKNNFELDTTFVLRNPSRKRIFIESLSQLYLFHDKLREKLARLIP